MIHGEFGPEFDALSIPARDPGQYLYENYLLIFGTTFAPKWKDLTAESRTNWGKLELATRIDCTCNSDPLGRCVVHSAVHAPPIEPEKIYTTYDGHRYKLAENRKPIWIDDLPSEGKCKWCEEGNLRVRSSVTERYVHTDTPIGRVLCGAGDGIRFY
jgi:hypothetical protein